MLKTAARNDEGKPRMAYILKFPKVMEALARINEHGEAKYELKYGVDNWKKGGKPDSEYLNACMRHLCARLDGEVYAHDSGCSHLGHAIWNLLVLLEVNHPDEIIDSTIFNSVLKDLKLDATIERTEEIVERAKQYDQESLGKPQTITFTICNNDRLEVFEKLISEYLPQFVLQQRK